MEIKADPVESLYNPRRGETAAVFELPFFARI